MKFSPTIFAALVLAAAVHLFAMGTRYEAESAIVDENSVLKVADAAASGGFYVAMKEGALSFKVTMPAAGYYTLWAAYSQPNDSNGKIQNLSVNGVSRGQISFPFVSAFTTIKASAKIKLEAGANTIEILKSWGWVNIDYIELSPYVATPFNIAPTLVSPNPSDNAKKVYGFLKENFLKKTVSGFMTNTVMQNDGKYTPNTVENQTEGAWIKAASGKLPALMGVDFMHATGLHSSDEWYLGYTKATLALAEDMFQRGGILTYSWHWKDPSLAVESFYSPSSGNTPNTDFNLNKAFLDSTTYAAFNPASPEYIAIIRDLDVIAGYLKTLSDKGIPVLLRPLHESSGKWFWWGYKGPKACKALYRLIFDRFTVTHGLNNLIWVWVTDEAGDAPDWYPGDKYVDIIGRDYYFYPRIANHGSLVASFEKLKDLSGGTKLITLSENGSIPHPDSMKADGANWSYFMPWYGDYTMDGWAHDNTAEDWKSIMGNDYVITLDKMPGWANYTPPAATFRQNGTATEFSVQFHLGNLDVTLGEPGADVLEVFYMSGKRLAKLNPDGPLSSGKHRFNLAGAMRGLYLVRARTGTENLVRRVTVTGN